MSSERAFVHDTDNQLRFDIEVSIEYHRRRAQFLFQFDRMSKLIAVVTGSSFVFKMLPDGAEVAFLGAASAVIALSTLIFRVAEKAADHVEAMRAFSEMHSKILSAPLGVPSEIISAEINKQRKEIEAKNHFLLNGLAHLCWNEIGKGWGRTQKFKISFVQRLVSQLFDIQSEFRQVPRSR